MNKHNQQGSINALLLPLILAVLMLLGAVGFGYWAYSGRQDYKDNVDQKISAAVTTAKQQEDIAKDKQFAELAKQPLKTYNGPEQFGSLVVMYPKTWSSYVDVNQDTLDGYFHPGTVPSVDDSNNNFALRVQVVNQTYNSVLSSFANQTSLTSAPYTLPKMPKVIGVKISGQFPNNKNGEMVVLPLRGQALEIYTQATQYQSDFDNNILPNFSFSP